MPNQPIEVIAFLITIAEENISKGRRVSEWLRLKTHANGALWALVHGNTDTACIEFYCMGQLHEGLNNFSKKDMGFAIKSVRAELKRIRPLQRKNHIAKIVKLTAQKIAWTEWKKDKEEKVRIAEMAEIVYPQVYEEIQAEFDEPMRDEALAALPDRPSGVIPWLRNEEVAPAYARKPGRPPKK